MPFKVHNKYKACSKFDFLDHNIIPRMPIVKSHPNPKQLAKNAKCSALQTKVLYKSDHNKQEACSRHKILDHAKYSIRSSVMPCKVHNEYKLYWKQGMRHKIIVNSYAMILQNKYIACSKHKVLDHNNIPIWPLVMSWNLHNEFKVFRIQKTTCHTNSCTTLYSFRPKILACKMHNKYKTCNRHSSPGSSYYTIN